MKIFEIKNVIIVLAVVICLTSNVESRPNGNGVSKVKTRTRKNSNDVSISRLFRRISAGEQLSFQGFLIRELFSKDNHSGKFGNYGSKTWLKRKVRQLERRYLKREFRKYRKARKIQRNRKRNGFKINKERKKNSRVKETKTMALKEFMSLSHHRGFKYKHIATLRSQQLKECQLLNLDTDYSPSGHRLIVGFNLSHLSQQWRFSADHAKLVMYLSQVNKTITEKNDDSNGDAEGVIDTSSCDVQIRELLRNGSEFVGMTDAPIITLPNLSIKNNAWSSFDISHIIKTSSAFSNNSGSNSILYNKDKNNDSNEDNNSSEIQPSLIYLSFEYFNCSFQGNGEEELHNYKRFVKNTISWNNKYAPNLKLKTTFVLYDDDKNSLLLLFTKGRKDNLDKRKTYVENDSDSDLDHTTLVQNFVRSSDKLKPIEDYNIENKEMNKILKNSSSSNPIPKPSGIHVNSGDFISKQIEDVLEFQTQQKINANDTSTLSMSAITKRRTKRRARRRRGRNSSCRRKEMYVDFSKMQWADFIVYPRGYQAYQCVGRCYSPISNYLTPTTHAVIQNLVHASQPRKASRVCCVPTKLTPISILFYDEHMNVDNKELKDMVVTECGCR